MSLRRLQALVPLTALTALTAVLAVACSPPAALGKGEDEQINDSNDDSEGTSRPPAGSGTGTPQQPPTPVVTLGKIHAAPVADFVVSNDALWVATGTTVERAALDGTAATQVSPLASATAIATDGTRIYGLLAQGSRAQLFSVKPDGSDGVSHSDWDSEIGDPTTLALNAGRVYMTTKARQAENSKIVSTKAAVGAADGWRTEEFTDSWFVPPAFTTDRLFAVDYSRQAAIRVSLNDGNPSVDIVRSDVPDVAGGIATDGTDVFTRTRQGIVKVGVGSDGNGEPTVVIPSSACPIADPGTGQDSLLEDDLVVDSTTIYTACRAGTNVEVRAYSKTGALTKTIATTPFNGGLSHLRVTSTAVYWLSQVNADSQQNELWRAGK
jgi:hypothetical protein